jgi:S-DNA-T family DNA segregation ATPase FtsK/SpoIIIE
MVDAMQAAATAAEIPLPRKPWLPELHTIYDLADPTEVPTARRDTHLVFGVRDDPDAQAQPVVAFEPDRDGNLAVFGAGGSGKSAFLRTIAAAASFTVRGGPCHVYGLDFGGRGLSMLEVLPHVGSIVAGNDAERVSRLIRWLRDVIDQRSTAYAAANVGSITDYRAKTGNADEPRIILLVDGVAAFRQAYEIGEAGRTFDTFVSLCADGRPFGVHIVMSADRPGAIHTALAATVQRRIVLRLADDGDYGLMGFPADVLSATSPPGRAMDGGNEVQIAILGSSVDVYAQAEATRGLAASMVRAGVLAAPPINRLADRIRLEELPVQVGGEPVLGLASASLEPIGILPEGSFVVTGPGGSGRTTALATLVASIARYRPDAGFYFIGAMPSSVSSLPYWRRMVMDGDDAFMAIAELESELQQATGSSVVVIEAIPDFLHGPVDLALQGLIRSALRRGHLVIAEGEVSLMMPSYPLLQLVRTSRSGLVLQPDQTDGLTVGSDFPRLRRSDFPEGRGVLVRKGVPAIVQVAQTGVVGGSE